MEILLKKGRANVQMTDQVCSVDMASPKYTRGRRRLARCSSPYPTHSFNSLPPPHRLAKLPSTLPRLSASPPLYSGSSRAARPSTCRTKRCAVRPHERAHVATSFSYRCRVRTRRGARASAAAPEPPPCRA